MNKRQDPFSQFLNSGRAATITLIALLAAFYVGSWATKSQFFIHDLAVFTAQLRPATLLLYPLASTGLGDFFFWQLLLLLWLYWVGCDLERALGTWKVFAFFWISALIGALSILLAALLIGRPLYLLGCLIPVGALTVAWGFRNRTVCVRLWCVLPVTGFWIAIIEFGIVLFAVGDQSPVAGLFALVPLVLSALYAENKLPGIPFSGVSRRESKVAKAQERRDKSYYDDVHRRAKEREEQEKLRKLFERSLDDNDK